MPIGLKLHICILIPISGSRCVLTGGACGYVFALIINFATANENLSLMRSIYHLEHTKRPSLEALTPGDAGGVEDAQIWVH